MDSQVGMSAKLTPKLIKGDNHPTIVQRIKKRINQRRKYEKST